MEDKIVINMCLLPLLKMADYSLIETKISDGLKLTFSLENKYITQY
ncbi:hypothetical protein BZ22_835 [Yersinia pseudotuberculosis YPIII]|uniref:Uncharacterized protein n=1 Tax=Yersinia pseudotuberculosis serotype O:3 (strain YPIII) TaxID=502800 RepID=A0A0H3AZS8_YERPY|nr:hypothetical protein BZ22_835 [Yersinia pseudotuberculosis YPIII]